MPVDSASGLVPGIFGALPRGGLEVLKNQQVSCATTGCYNLSIDLRIDYHCAGTARSPSMISIAMAASPAWSLRSPIFFMHFQRTMRRTEGEKKQHPWINLTFSLSCPSQPLPALSFTERWDLLRKEGARRIICCRRGKREPCGGRA